MIAVRHRRAEGTSGSTTSPRAGAASPSASPSPSTAPTPRSWRPTPSATATSGSSTARRRGTPASTRAQYDLIFARTSGKPGDGAGITAFLVPTDTPGFKVEEFLWTFNMPTDHARISLTDVRVPRRRDLRRRGPRPAGRAALLQREPHPPGRLQPRAPRSSASTSRSSTPRSASRSASRWPPTRPSSSRSSSCRRSARCCGR